MTPKSLFAMVEWVIRSPPPTQTDSVTNSLPDLRTLRDACTVFARDAAIEIMRIYAGDLGERTKEDKSPVTDADHAAEVVIVAGLRALTPGLPVVAEEEMAAGHVPKLDGGPFWLVDPLDGTKEFIKRNGEFTVNIALIEKGRPTLGIVLAPSTDTLWRGAAGLGADKCGSDGVFKTITTRPAPPEGFTACASRSHAIYSDLDIWFRNNNLTVTGRVQAGSSLKFCLIAEGKADIYPRFGPTNEWDTAAGQGVLEAAGGEVVTTDGRPLLYGKPRFSNPHFIARSLEAR
jgi:3'(2'), 5'-bisphosphate nucleotidase